MQKNKAVPNTKYYLKKPRIFFILILLFAQTAKADNKSIANLISNYVAAQKQEQLSLLEKLVNNVSAFVINHAWSGCKITSLFKILK